MQSTFKQGVRSIVLSLFLVTIAVLAASSNVLAQTHVISSAELRQQTLDATRARAENIQQVTDFVTSPKAEQALRTAHIDPNQVRAAVSSLGDEELADLAARAAKAKLDFAAGDLSDRDLLLILVGVAVVILIIVAVR